MSSKRALITGASRGIGLALAHVFAREGYDLFLVARSRDELSEAAARIRSDYPVDVRVCAIDLTTEGAADKVFQAVAGRVDVLVNNAGVGLFGLFTGTSWEREEALLQLNVRFLTQLTKLVVADMCARGSGRVLNVSSVAAFLPGPYMSVYYASKAYVKSFSESLSEEVRSSGVVVSCLCPGPTYSGFAEAAGAQKTGLFSGDLMTAGEVAEYGYRSLMRGRRVAVPGFRNKVNVFLTKVLPRRLQARIVRRLSEKKK